VQKQNFVQAPEGDKGGCRVEEARWKDEINVVMKREERRILCMK
jgi:hypothetical protein